MTHHKQDYQYPHDFPGHHVAQQYLPDSVKGKRWYEPGTEGYEREVKERLQQWRTTLIGTGEAIG